MGADMKFCIDHWAKLRAAIDERGLTPLVSQGGASAAEKMLNATADGASLDNFDPLLAAHNMILKHALNAVGFEIFAPNSDGTDRCPLCFLRAEHEKQCTNPQCGQDFDKWIDFAADGAKRFVDEQMAKR
jgi:hypothetical protein